MKYAQVIASCCLTSDTPNRCLRQIEVSVCLSICLACPGCKTSRYVSLACLSAHLAFILVFKVRQKSLSYSVLSTLIIPIKTRQMCKHQRVRGPSSSLCLRSVSVVIISGVSLSVSLSLSLSLCLCLSLSIYLSI